MNNKKINVANCKTLNLPCSTESFSMLSIITKINYINIIWVSKFKKEKNNHFKTDIN